MPGNLHSMSEGQVRSVCAAHGMIVSKDTSKAKMIAIIESDLHGDNDAGNMKRAPSLLADKDDAAPSSKRRKGTGTGKGTGKGKGKGKSTVVDLVDDSSSDGEDSDAWSPEG